MSEQIITSNFPIPIISSKTILIIVLFLFKVSFSQNQNTTPNQSNAEIFSSQSGILVEKKFEPVGNINKIKLEIITLTDMISGQSVKSLRLKKEILKSYSSNSKIASIDKDEIDALIKSIEVINKEVFKLVPENYTEITFRSRSGLEMGCYWSKNQWKSYIQIKKYDNESLVRLDKETFLSLLELLKQVKIKIG